MNENPQNARRTIQEAKQFLNEHRDEYVISKIMCTDAWGARTRVMVWLKKKTPLTFNPFTLRHSPFVNSALTIQELVDRLTSSQRNYPDRKFVFEERQAGEIHMVFDMPTPMEDPKYMPYKMYTMRDVGELPQQMQEYSVGSKMSRCEKNKGLGYVYIIIQLDQEQEWFLMVCFDDPTCQFRKYILNYRGKRWESYYEFRDEASVRKLIYQAGDEEKTLDELFIRYIKEHSGDELVEILRPYFIAQYHDD